MKKTKTKKPSLLSKLIGAKYIKDNAEEIKDSAKKVLIPKYARENARNETFNEAVDRLNVTDADIEKIKKNYILSFWVSFGAFIFCFIGLLYSLFISKNLLIGASFISISLIMLANSFRFSFRTFQITHKELCSPKKWWDTSSEWFPKY